MTVSMTGYASRTGQGAGYGWSWDLRSVNGKGLDLRLRVPDWIDGVEPVVKAELARQILRGNVSLTLKVSRDALIEAGLVVNPVALMQVLKALQEVEACAMDAGLTLAQPNGADVLAVRGVLEMGSTEGDLAPLRAVLIADLRPLLEDFQKMRLAEGAQLASVILGQLDRIAALTSDAIQEADARRDAAEANLRVSLQRVLSNADGVDEARLSQELALLAVKTDVTEELDRLGAHVVAARTLLLETGSVGRKFDFLMQEFMREANTLCSKSQSLALTRIGLDLKTVIDQLREQVQNVE